MNTNAEPERTLWSPDKTLIDQIYTNLASSIYQRRCTEVSLPDGQISGGIDYELRRAALFANIAAEILANFEKPQ